MHVLTQVGHAVDGIPKWKPVGKAGFECTGRVEVMAMVANLITELKYCNVAIGWEELMACSWV